MGLNQNKKLLNREETMKWHEKTAYLNEMKWNERQPIEWEKVFANDISNNELISQNYKEFLQLSIKTNNLI